VKALRRAGYSVTGQRGSHVKPCILKEAGIPVEEFLRLL